MGSRPERPCAYNLIRSQPEYRHEAFDLGLRACGFEVRSGTPIGRRGDLLVQWNRYWGNHETATKFEAAGGVVLVAENGYLGGRHDGGEYYALARGYHNDSTVVRRGSGDRWRRLGIKLKPWRKTGEHILVLPNRSFGVPGRVMPANWPQTVVERLRRVSWRPVVVRPHPGNAAPQKPLSEDLAGAWAAAIWSSSAGVSALVSGVPVIAECPYWICREAAGRSLKQVEDPPMPNRLPAMHRLAAAQFTLEEIGSGAAFRRTLGR